MQNKQSFFKTKIMNKVFLSFLLLISSFAYSQDYIKVKRLEVTGSIKTPEDTISIPRWVGEIRYRPQDGHFYKAISKTAPKKWDYLGGSITLTNGLEGSGYMRVLTFPDSLTALARSVAVFGAGGMRVVGDSTGTQLFWTVSLPDQTGQNGKVLGTNGTTASWVDGGTGGSGVTTVQTVAGFGNSNGMSISGTNISLHKVTTTTPGVLTNNVDSINGDKYWFGNHIMTDGSFSFKLTGTENIYRGLWFYTPGGVNFGGFLYNPQQAKLAYGDFTGGLGISTDFYSNSSVRIVLPTNPGIQFPEFGSGNRTGTPAYDLAVTSNGTLVERVARPFYIGSAIATIDFETASSGTPNTQTITVTGAQLSDEVRLGIPHAAMTATSVYTAWVSAANTVSIRLTTQASENPSPGQFKVSVYRH